MAYYCVTASIERLNAKVIPDGPREVQACVEITELWDLKRLECEIVGFSPYLLLLLAPGSRCEIQPTSSFCNVGLPGTVTMCA